MSEAEWQRCIDPDLMQEYLRRTNTVSDRKFRLFGCACCRRVAHRLTDERNRRVIELEERYADGLVSRAKLRAAWIAAGAGVVDARAALEDAGAALGISRFLVARRPVGELGGAWLAALATAQNGGHPAWRAALGATNCAAMASAWGAAGSATGTAAWTAVGDAEEDGPWTAPWNAARKAGRLVEEKAQAALLRHI